MNRKNVSGCLMNIHFVIARWPTYECLTVRLPTLTKRRPSQLAFVDKITVLQRGLI